MIESGYYPPGAEYDKKAPYNKVENPVREIEVTVSMTLSKTIKIKVSDYKITDSGKDDDGNHYEDIDYSDCNLKEAVEEQTYLPYEAHKLIKHCLYGEVDINKLIKDLSNWNIDEFEVIKD